MGRALCGVGYLVRAVPRGAVASAWVGLMLLVASSGAYAQMLPSAGSLLKQLQNGHSRALPRKAAPVFTPPPPLKSISGPTVTVKQFRIQGNHLLTNRVLSEAVSRFLHHPLTFSQLQNAAIAVADAYRKAGWVVRAYLPQQDVTHGVVVIEVIEAQFGAVDVQSNPARISSARLKAMVNAAQRRGKPVNANALDRALLLINDLPGVSAKGQLAPGKKQAQTDLVLETQRHPVISGAVSVDDAGQRYTGAAQITVAMNLNSPLHIGDLAQIIYLHSKGTDFESADYDLPVGDHGLRLGLDASHLSYHIVTAQFAALDARGHSDTADLHASYPIVRTRLGNLYISAAAGDKWFDNQSRGTTISRYAIESGRVTLSGNRYDDLGAGGSTTASISFDEGLVDLAGAPNEVADAETADTAGRFYKVNISLARLQALTPWLSIYASAAGQYASKNLDSSEMLYLGGENGIRAYPTNEGGGSEGILSHLEARVGLPRNIDLTAFVDWGEIYFDRNVNFPGAPKYNTDVLKGGGLALAWTAPFGLTLRIAVARRIGSNPHPTRTGLDQNGTLVENRVWAEASMPF